MFIFTLWFTLQPNIYICSYGSHYNLTFTFVGIRLQYLFFQAKSLFCNESIDYHKD